MLVLTNLSLKEIKFHTRVWLGGAKLIREVGLFDCQLVHIASASLYSRVVSLFFIMDCAPVLGKWGIGAEVCLTTRCFLHRTRQCL